MMLKSASLGRNYSTGNGEFIGTLAVSAGEVDLRASVSDDASACWPTFGILSFAVEKPGSFSIDYDVPKKDVRFQFTKNLNMLERPLNLTYTHVMSENRTLLNGTLELDSANKLSANYEFYSGNCKLKYSYAHGGTTLEPCYDFGNKSLDLAASQRFLDGNLIGATYKTSSKTLGLEWSSNSKHNKNLRFKVSALLELAKGLHMPILNAESFWDFSL
ncbi:outer envelope pore protein 24B, chloroplastic-like [Juglans microcarpa x Juglans regia]|uniref:outer envelope pore protein 24B, chloroplastic-like n=1 Tax=Juglans microcarpa x Juglans regia TaxID=2249226 RepID=UPI001B7E10C5|nr:outer envelope pore protein 24B, chloroplastic-like [Juglans microcarpa x Juglans regia]XP_041008802.1 outer envelope pore protein 24B, chloroplastic-like [Juglans microcarpa x Juglans regia]